MYYSGATPNGNIYDGWPGFLRSVDVKEFAGVALASDVEEHGNHTDLDEYQLDIATDDLYISVELNNHSPVNRLVATQLDGEDETQLDMEPYYSYGLMLVKEYSNLYWFSQAVENYVQVGMNIVIVPTAGSGKNTSTTFATSWYGGLRVVLRVRN
jgi:hypothetical protein